MHSKRRKVVASTNDKIVTSQERGGQVVADVIVAPADVAVEARGEFGAGCVEVGDEMVETEIEVGGAVEGGSGPHHHVVVEHEIVDAMESKDTAVETVAELEKHETKTVEVEEDEEEEEQEEQEEHKQVVEKAWTPDGVVTGRILLSSTGQPTLMDDGVLDLGTGVANSIEGSRSRSEDGIGAIGGATRIEDTGTSQWKEVDLIDWEDQSLGVQSEQEQEHPAPNDALREETEVADTEVGKGFQGRSLIDSVMVTEASEKEGGNDENIDSVPVAEEAASESDSSSIGKEDKGNSSAPSAYSRAFSKIFKSKPPSSELGPVLSARQSLVAQKLDAEACENKFKKEAKKEKKELHEKAHVLPQPYTDTKEKDLIKLATRGVVKLFNAVSKAQKVQAGADSRDAKVIAKQSKSAFFSELKSPGPSNVQGTLTTGKGRALQPAEPLQFATVDSHQRDFPPTSHWSVVQENFMLGREKLKGWDQSEDFGTLEGQNMIGNQVADGPDDDFSDDDDDDDD